MPNTIGSIALALVFVLLIVLIFSAIGVTLLLALGWLLAWLTPLTFLQAIILTGLTGLVTAYLAEQQFSGLLPIIGTVLVATFMVLLSSAAIAWAADRVSALDYWQASLLATLVALMVLYIFATRLGEFAEGLEPVGAEGEEEDEEEDEVVFRVKPPASQVWTVGRNDPCPCGSGKKFKHCHGQLRG